jgi:hypothetical protein
LPIRITLFTLPAMTLSCCCRRHPNPKPGAESLIASRASSFSTAQRAETPPADVLFLF